MRTAVKQLCNLQAGKAFAYDGGTPYFGQAGILSEPLPGSPFGVRITPLGNFFATDVTDATLPAASLRSCCKPLGYPLTLDVVGVRKARITMDRPDWFPATGSAGSYIVVPSADPNMSNAGGNSKKVGIVGDYLIELADSAEDLRRSPPLAYQEPVAVKLYDGEFPVAVPAANSPIVPVQNAICCYAHYLGLRIKVDTQNNGANDVFDKFVQMSTGSWKYIESFFETRPAGFIAGNGSEFFDGNVAQTGNRIADPTGAQTVYVPRSGNTYTGQIWALLGVRS